MVAPVAPYKDLKAAKGSMVPVFFSIAKLGTPPNETTYLRGCYKRGFENSDSFDSIDITGDCSEGGYKESISGFRESTVSIDFVARSSDKGGVSNQAALWSHLKAPSAVTNNEPVVWLLWFHPVFNKKIVQCFTCTSISDNFQYDDAVSFSTEFNALGAPNITNIPAL